MSPLGPSASIADVCDVETVEGPGADPVTPADLLIEVPHGATTTAHYRAVSERLHSSLPDGLPGFFHVNTDVGAPECARAVARMIVEPEAHPAVLSLLGDEAVEGVGSLAPRKVLLVRGLVPRTFIDCNRVIDVESAEFHRQGLTQAVPGYIRDPRDLALLRELHAAYARVADRAFAEVCGGGGTALILHTYAPKSVRIVDVDDDIVVNLRKAYEPARYATWEDRPQVDVISAAADGTSLAPADLVDGIRGFYNARGIEVAENATYRLHPATMGHRHSTDHPNGVVCMEVNRAMLADPFQPFVEMTIGDAKVETMAAPVAAALWASLVERRRVPGTTGAGGRENA